MRAAETHTKGTLHLGDRDLPFTQDVFFELPGRLREVLYLDAGEQKVRLTTVFDGEHGWMNDGRKTSELDARMLREVRESTHAAQAARLVPLLDRSVQFKALGDTTVAGKPAATIRISKPGLRDIELSFDRDSGLLVKVRRQVVDLSASAEAPPEVIEERFLSDYREVQGVQ